MTKPDIERYDLHFTGLSERYETNMIVIHHTGNPEDYDISAPEIHTAHRGQGWSGIGYHFVIRKDGTIEEGRPLWTVGAHAYGHNYHTIGIHLSGNFEIVEPTDAQIESVAMLVGWLCEGYGLPVNENTVLGHRDLMATDCPGRTLYEMLPTIRGKAIWYQHHG